MTSSTPLSSASSSRLPTLKELDSKLNISGLRKYDDEIQAAARKNREEASKDLELQERVDKVRERLRATIAAKKAKDETGEFLIASPYAKLFATRRCSGVPPHRWSGPGGA